MSLKQYNQAHDHAYQVEGGCAFRVRQDYRLGNLAFLGGGKLSCPL